MEQKAKRRFAPEIGTVVVLELLGGMLLTLLCTIYAAPRGSPILVGLLLCSGLFYYAAYRCREHSFFSLVYSMICCVMIGVTIISRRTSVWNESKTALLVLGVLAVVYLLGYVLFRRFRGQPVRLCWWLLSMRLVIYCCLCQPVFYLVYDAYSWINTQSMVANAEGTALQEAYLQDHLAQLSPLADEAQWQTLSQEEKLEILDTVMQVERTYLGIPYELTLTAQELEENLLGYYSPACYAIVINAACLDDPWQNVRTVCHESYHAYEHAMVELYDSIPAAYRDLQPFREVPQWDAEFSDYIDGTCDTSGAYYEQEVERAARDYAKNAVLEYTWRICTYSEE